MRSVYYGFIDSVIVIKYKVNTIPAMKLLYMTTKHRNLMLGDSGLWDIYIY